MTNQATRRKPHAARPGPSGSHQPQVQVAPDESQPRGYVASIAVG
jgi:hypothetical protein